MNARLLARRSWTLAALLVAGFVAVPLAHGARHAQKHAEAIPGTASVETPCDLCHLTYVAVTSEVLVASSIVPLGVADERVSLLPPSVPLLARRPRGPPPCS